MIWVLSNGTVNKQSMCFDIFVDHLFLWPVESEVSIVILGRQGKYDTVKQIDDTVAFSV